MDLRPTRQLSPGRIEAVTDAERKERRRSLRYVVSWPFVIMPAVHVNARAMVPMAMTSPGAPSRAYVSCRGGPCCSHSRSDSRLRTVDRPRPGQRHDHRREAHAEIHLHGNFSHSVSARVLLTMSVDYIGAISKKQARNADLFDGGEGIRQSNSAPVVMVMVMPVVMMAMRPPIVVMMMVRSPVTVLVVMMMPPLHFGGQPAGVALHARGDPWTERRCRLRLLRGGRDNQKCAKGGKS